MHKNILAGSILTALVAAMLSVSPATANELPPPPIETANITVLDDVPSDRGNGLDGDSPTTGLDAPQSRTAPGAGRPAVPEESKEPTEKPADPSEPAVQTTQPQKSPEAQPPTATEATQPAAGEETGKSPAPATTKAPAPAKAPANVTPKATTPPPPTTRQTAEPTIAVSGAIATRWKSLKGEAGELGAPTAAAKTTNDHVSQQFSGGVIYDTNKYGVQHILKSSKIGKTWFAKGESFYGFPVSDEIGATYGSYQKFSKNYWIFSNGNPLQINGGIGSKWKSMAGLSALGSAESAEICGQANGCYQNFTKGALYWSPKTGAQVMGGGILSRYRFSGGAAGYIGYPTTQEFCTLVSKGCYQNFERGLIMWSSLSGAYEVPNGAIRRHYGSTGTANGFLGYPTSGETCDSRGCSQRYQGGTIYWSGLTGAQSVKNGKLHNAYRDRNAYKGLLGFPRAGEVCGQLPKSGCYQDFSNGRLYSNTGQSWAFRTNGGIGAAYYAKGGPNGNLGYPLADERCSGGQCAQTFQGGAIGWGADASGTYGMSECQYLNDGRSRYSGEGSKHVLLTFTETYRQAYATNVYCKNIAGVYVTEWRTDGYVGASGFVGPGEASGPTRNLYSPSGSFTVTEAFGLGNPGTALPYRTLNPNSRWGGNPWTPTYNKYHESSKWEGWDENMWYFAQRSTRDYEQGAVINYNRPDNIVQDAGFAIFLHQNKVPTAGCISIDNWAMVDYLRKSVSGDRIIMGVRSAIFK